MGASVYDYSAARLQGGETCLEEFRGQVLLIVNTASRCGFTPQYAGLEKLYQDHRQRGFAVLGFPCNQFGGQEPGDADGIASFCRVNYGVSFPLFAKIKVNGREAHPLYVFLKAEARGIGGSEAVKWNFTKFLVDRQGRVVERYAPATRPEELAAAVEALLAE
ncbi:MAG TPA: glutathione peroxidase [Rhodocyclaceae bacterium]|nr:glutathione peroxidase [Rhodocyclaceae bacterium]